MLTEISNLSINPNPILYCDHFVYHLTRKEKMEKIVTEGLKPKCGKNSKRVGDSRRAIYFFDNLRYLYNWVYVLYSIEDSDQLELLRFNLKIKKWYRLCQQLGEGYVKRIIPPEEIEYAESVAFTKANPKEIKLKWKQLGNYPLI